MSNPLLALDGLPPFSAILPGYVEPAVDQVLVENRAAIARLLDTRQNYSWANLVEPLAPF